MVIKRSKVGGGIKVSWGAEHRNGKCELCHIPFENFDTGKRDEWGPITIKQCPQCGGRIGELISRQTSIEAPEAPACLTPPCLWQYMRDALFYSLVCNYHARRVAYAEANRNEEILERYRTGEPSPQTIWQAIHANIKLTCPVCRKYNVDPFSFR